MCACLNEMLITSTQIVPDENWTPELEKLEHTHKTCFILQLLLLPYLAGRLLCAQSVCFFALYYKLTFLRLTLLAS